MKIISILIIIGLSAVFLLRRHFAAKGSRELYYELIYWTVFSFIYACSVMVYAASLGGRVDLTAGGSGVLKFAGVIILLSLLIEVFSPSRLILKLFKKSEEEGEEAREEAEMVVNGFFKILSALSAGMLMLSPILIRVGEIISGADYSVGFFALCGVILVIMCAVSLRQTAYCLRRGKKAAHSPKAAAAEKRESAKLCLLEKSGRL